VSQVGLAMSHDTEEKPAPPKRSRLAVVIAVVVVVALIGAVGYFGYTKFLAKGPDYSGDGHGEVTIQIVKGQSIPSMGDELVKANVVKSAQAFVEAASADARARGIQVGYYKMKLEMSAASALDLLTDPDNLMQGNVLVVEGAGMLEVIVEASKATKIPLADFQAVLKNPKGIGLPAYAGNNAEGFLFPATYSFGPDATATSVLTAMVTKFKEVAASINLDARAAARGRKPYDIVKIASIEEKEGFENYFSQISQVIYNRLAVHEILGMDSTVNYGLGISVEQLTADQKLVDTPYNTFRHQGLPPTPISNPGKAALEAALEPAIGTWMYFLSIPGTKEMRFSTSAAQFERDKKDMQAAYDRQKSASAAPSP